MTFDRSKLHSGLWFHVRSNWWLGRGIRYALNKWERRVCNKLQVPFKECWGNHDGILIGPDVPHIGDPWCIGEALSQGSILTSLSKYERDIASGKIAVRVFEVATWPANQWRAAAEWTINVDDHGYDYWAYAGLIAKAFLNIDVATGEREHFWCTEGVQAAYLAMKIDVLQDKTPTPLQVEQVAGLVPRPEGRTQTLREVTDEIML